MSATTAPTTAIRNYLILAAAVAITSIGLTDIFTAPSRIAQQDRIDGYTQYAGVGLVAATQSLPR